MTLRRNVLANYAGQAYATLIGIVMLPFYLEFLGAEAYGLVSFFTLLHAWLAILTSGISPTLSRQVAHFRGLGELGGSGFRVLLRSIELVVLALALLTTLIVWYFSTWLAAQWLTVDTLALDDVTYCIALMGGMVGLRWGVALYAAALSGMERQVWLNGFGILFATLRFAAAYILLRWVTQAPTHYFEFQLGVSLLELVAVGQRFYRCQSSYNCASDPGWCFSWPALRAVLPFTLGIAYTSMLWVLMTQSDKLILSHMLSLAEYGYFALVVLIANGVLQFSAPISQAVLPRLTLLLSQGKDADMRALYRKATQIVVVVVAAASGMLALFPQQVLFMLTGSEEAARWGAPVLPWFSLGNAILVIVGMQYVLQYAHGKMRMHVVNSSLSAVVQVPIMVYVALNHSAVAVAIAWFLIRLVTFFIWPAIVHHRLAPGLHRQWLWLDVLLPLVGGVFGLVLVKLVASGVVAEMESRWQIAATLGVGGIFALATGVAMASSARGMLVRKVGKYVSV